MVERTLSDADAVTKLLQSDPFASGIHRVLQLDEAAALLAERVRVEAVFTKDRVAPVLVVIGGEDDA